MNKVAIGGEFTLRLLRDAGIGQGMRALDVGCGTGDVSFLVADLVGAGGEVVGIDRNGRALEAASARADELGLANVTFVEADLAGSLNGIGAFDAVVGRRVLMYQPDTVETVRKLAHRLQPGGLMVFHEHDTTMVPVCRQAMPLHFKVQGWLREMVARESADLSMGLNLHGVLTQAGLSVEHVRAEAIVQTPTQTYPLADIVKAVLPRILEHDVANSAEVDIDTLEQRLQQERLSVGATYIGDMMFGAWARKAASAEGGND